MQRRSSAVAALATGCQGRSRFNVGNQSVSVPRQLAEVALDLDAVPELVRLTVEGAKMKRHGRRDRPSAKDDFVDALGETPMARPMAYSIERCPRREVFPYEMETWYVPKSVKIAYGISFNRYIYKRES